MKASELMVGDLLQRTYNHKIVRVHEIKQSCIYTEDNGYEYNEVEPIPLTPEILEKSGFVKFISSQYILPICSADVILTKIEGMPNTNGKWLVAIKKGYTDAKIAITYVHELQQALKLCKIEKEIVL